MCAIFEALVTVDLLQVPWGVAAIVVAGPLHIRTPILCSCTTFPQVLGGSSEPRNQSKPCCQLHIGKSPGRIALRAASTNRARKKAPVSLNNCLSM